MTWTTQPRSKVGPLAAMLAGNGQRVLLLHGVGLRSEAWAPIFTDLAQDYAVQAPDMPVMAGTTVTGCVSFSRVYKCMKDP